MPDDTKADLIHDSDAGIERLLEIMRRLRDPETGCPWDIEQDFDSIAPYTIEEAYEVADAIARRDWVELEGELGDLLLQSVYHTAMGEEAGYFSFQSVVRNISVMANLGRHLGLDPEAALRAANAKFTRRFEGIEARLAAMGKSPHDSDLAEMDALWDAVKLAERS